MPIVEIRMPEDEKEGTEAAVGTWLKKVGDEVAENEPLVEISTDKVTLEIAAPAAGIIREQVKQPGDRVMPGDLLGMVESDAAGAAPTQTLGSASAKAALSAPAMPSAAGSSPEAFHGYSPAVRKLLSELGLDPKNIPKSGRGGRLTPEDIGSHLKSGTESGQGRQAAAEVIQFTGRLTPHTPMRKSIASHMAHSLQSAPHVTSVFEADLSEVLADRERRKQSGNGDGAPSVTAYLIQAAIQAIHAVPEVNSKWHDAHLETFEHVNFGVGTALDTGGLVVPVIQRADTMDLLALSHALREMTAKARAGKLTQADMQGGTFTLSNHGVSGSLLAAPIILPHGQAAILGAGKLQKRVIVCETGGRELFRVRPMMYVTLTVDHRVLDGQQTNGFLTSFVQALEKPSIG